MIVKQKLMLFFLLITTQTSQAITCLLTPDNSSCESTVSVGLLVTGNHPTATFFGFEGINEAGLWYPFGNPAGDEYEFFPQKEISIDDATVDLGQLIDIIIFEPIFSITVINNNVDSNGIPIPVFIRERDKYVDEYIIFNDVSHLIGKTIT